MIFITVFKGGDLELCTHSRYDKVILWFEHDLYDQLQLLQLLDWFAENLSDKTQLTIICTDQYLGMVSAEQVELLWKFEVPVSEAMLNLARKSWSAFRLESPMAWQELTMSDTSALPFLKAAMVRMMGEYPDAETGLSLTEEKTLEILVNHDSSVTQLFKSYQETEEPRYLGDSSFWIMLKGLIDTQHSLVQLGPGDKLEPWSTTQIVSISQRGRDILLGKKRKLDFSRLIAGWEVCVSPRTVYG